MSDMDKSIIAMMNRSFESGMAGATTTASTSTAETLNMDRLAERIRHIRISLESFTEPSMFAGEAQAMFFEAPRLKPWRPQSFDTLFGVPIRESYMATKREPARVHVQRRGQKMRYHLRIQKKWNKRFGFVNMPAALLMAAGAVGGKGHVLLVHPTIVARFREGKVFA